MSIIQNYRKAQSAQINLDDGNKVLVGYGLIDMRVLKLGFLSLFNEKVYIFDNKFLSSLINKVDNDLSKDVVKILSDELVKASSLDEIKRICKKLEENNDFIDKI